MTCSSRPTPRPSNTPRPSPLLGPDGKLGIAISVSTTIGDTDAYLDGTANVAQQRLRHGRDAEDQLLVLVPARVPQRRERQRRASRPTRPATCSRTSRARRPGWPSRSCSRRSPLIPNLINQVKDGLGLDTLESATGTRSDFQAAAAFGVGYETNSSHARIGDGNTSDPTDHAVVKAGGAISVSSSVAEAPSIAIGATAQPVPDDPNKPVKNADHTKTFTGTVSVGVTLAVSFGDYVNHSDAYISGNAAVDAKGAISVGATPQARFNPSSTYGTNLLSFADKSTYSGKYTSASGVQVLRANDTVNVPSTYDKTKGGGTSNTIYTYVGPDGATVDLGTEDYTNTLRWTGSSATSAAAAGFLNNLKYFTGYLNSNLGLSNFLTNDYTQSVATGQEKAAIAGSVAVLLLAARGTPASRRVPRSTRTRRSAARRRTCSCIHRARTTSSAWAATSRPPA